tara:strand:- start:16116 stop:17441 length:1326 start_codon:yes stop_codon:yes gene_type:complete
MDELSAIDTTIRMYTHPSIEIDTSYLMLQLDQIKSEKDAAVKKAGTTVEVLQSNPKFAEALEAFGVEVPMKTSPRTGKQAFALAKNDAEFLELLDHSQEVRDLVEARLAVKSTIEQSRMERLLDIGNRKGAFPINLKYAAALTQRFSGGEAMNPQNMTRRIRKALRAPAGHLLCEVDSSQIEARIIAWLASDDPEDRFLGAFVRGEDVYKQTASFIYGTPVEETSPEQRQRGKITTLAAGFGLSPDALLRTFKVAGIKATQEDAIRCIQAFRRNYAGVPRLWADADRCLGAMHFNMNYRPGVERQTAEFGKRVEAVRFYGEEFILPNGTPIKYPELTKDDRDNFSYYMKTGHVRIFGAKVVENIVQSLARQLLIYWMARIKESSNLQIALTVHDSILVVTPREKADETTEFLEATMKLGPNWSSDLPLQCESKIGECYGDI